MNICYERMRRSVDEPSTPDILPKPGQYAHQFSIDDFRPKPQYLEMPPDLWQEAHSLPASTGLLYLTAQEASSSRVAMELEVAPLANGGPSATARELPSNQAMNEEYSAPGSLC